MTPWNNPKVISKTPLATVLLLEGGNAQQLWRMWTERTSAGQSLWGWLSVGAALVLWWNFYRVITPSERFARWATAFGISMNLAVSLSVLFFRVTRSCLEQP